MSDTRICPGLLRTLVAPLCALAVLAADASDAPAQSSPDATEPETRPDSRETDRRPDSDETDRRSQSRQADRADDSENQRLVSDSTTDEQCPKNLPPEDASDPKQLTLLGVSCFKSEQFAQAFTYYHRAYQIDQSDALRAAMGRSLHELGIYELAKFYYEDFLEGQPSKGRSVRKIRRRLGQLEEDIETRGVRTKLRSLPPDAMVHLQLSNGDWVELGKTPTVVDLREGRYRFAFERPDYRRRHTRKRLSRATNPAVVDVEMYHASSIFEVSSQKWKRAGFITGLSSLPFFGTGILLFGLTKDKFDEAADLAPNTPQDELTDEPKRLVQEGHRLQRVAIGVTSVGGLAALTGGLLYLRGVMLQPSGSDVAVEGASFDLRWVVTPDYVGLRGQF